MCAAPGPRQIFLDKESSIEEQVVQILNLPHDSNELYTALERLFGGERIRYLPRIESSDSQPLNVPSCDYFDPLCNQAGYYSVPLLHPHWKPQHWQLATGPPVLSSGQIPEASVQMTLAPDMSDGYLGDEVRAFADNQVHENASRLGQYITDQNILRGAISPFHHWNGNDVQLNNPNVFRADPYGHSSHLLPQQLAYMPDTHPEPPSEHHPGQEVEGPEFGESQRIPEIEIAQSSENEVMQSKRWLCPRDDCDKSYGRPQDVGRHIRAEHEISLAPRCFVCDMKWTRAENIKKHLISRHRDHFTKEQRRKIRCSRGLNNTIDFLERLRLEIMEL